jgi:hypothetical protein
LNKILIGERISNVGGYLNNMVNNPTLFEVQKQGLDEKKSRRVEKQQVDSSKRKEQEEQKRKDDLLNSYTKEKNEMIKSIIVAEQLGEIIIQSLEQQAQEEKPTFLVKLALERYQVFQKTYNGNDHLLDAFDKAGFSFSTYVSDWIVKHYPDSLNDVQSQYQKQADIIGVNLA